MEIITDLESVIQQIFLIVGDTASQAVRQRLFSKIPEAITLPKFKMANFTASNLLKAQTRIAQKFTEQELRTKQSPAFALGLKNRSLLIPGHEEVRTREDRSVEVAIMARSKRAAGNARAHNHTGNRNDSFMVPLSWTTFSDKFSISIKQMDNNIFSFEEALATGFYNCGLNIHEAIETFMIDYLMAQRTQVNAGGPDGTFNATTDAFEIAAANNERFVQILKGMMRKNNYRGQLDAIFSQGLYLGQEYIAAQGSGNTKNLGFQFAGLNMYESIELADADYAKGVALVMPEGNFGVLPWIPKQNRTGRGDFNTYNGGYGVIDDPMGTGLKFAVHGYTQRADTSALNGATQDEVMEFEVSVDLATVLPPLSVATETVVFEVAQLAV